MRFPEESLHSSFDKFETILDRRSIDNCTKICMDVGCTSVFRETVHFKALVALATEAKACKVESDGSMYIKCIRATEGYRNRFGGSLFNPHEVCHDCGEHDPQSTAEKKFTTSSVAVGISQIIFW